MFINGFKNHIMPTFTANKMPKNQAEYIDNKLQSAKTVDIICHKMSDEDTFNSATTMYTYLQQSGIKPRIIVSGGQSNYNFDTSKYDIVQDKDISDSTKPADLALCVDFSSKDRVDNNISNHLQKFDMKNIIGFDHHNNPIKLTPNFNQITEAYKSTQDMPKSEPQNLYIDSSAKSNCSIIYRFFEALNKIPTKDMMKNMLCGLVDDTSKEGFIKFEKNNKMALTSKLDADFNTKEVFNGITSKLNDADKADIVKHLDVMNSITPQEESFRDNLDKKVKFSDKGKFAYVEIAKDDKEWESLGKDSLKTTTILKEYRKNLLEKDKNIQAVAVFYPSNTDGIYKMSMHSNADYAKQIVDYIKSNINPDLIAGGHDNRNGGSIENVSTEQCQKWVQDFKTAADSISY